MDRSTISIYKEYSAALKEVTAAKDAAIELSRQRGKAWSEYYTLMKKLKPLEEQMDPADVEWLRGESDFNNPKDCRMVPGAPRKPVLKRERAESTSETGENLNNRWLECKKTRAELVDLSE